MRSLSGDGETWAVHCFDNTIWHWNQAGVGAQVSGLATKIAMRSTPDATCGDHLPFIIGTDGNIYMYSHANGCTSGHYAFGSNGAGSDISTDFAVGTDGHLYKWSATTSVWSDYIASPFGTSTMIGAWANGIFAMHTSSGAIQRISSL